MTSDAQRARLVAHALARVIEEVPPNPAGGNTSQDGAPAAPSALSGTRSRQRTLSVTEAQARAQHALQRAAAMGARVLLPDDPEFPAHLQELPDAPRILFALGRTELLQRRGVAVVGSRDHSADGLEACARVVVAAVAAGATVISGLARGIDAAAHRETLLLNGDTIAVLGTGIDIAYPRINRPLYDAVRTRGLVLSEYPPGMPAAKHTFIHRNRIIAGLAAVTVVVEAGAKSGALKTAGRALDLGRDVMVVPGPITSRTHEGSNRLLRDGAAPFLEPADLWGLLGVVGTPTLPARPLGALLPADLSAAERQVALELDGGERGLDELGLQLGTPSHDLAGALLGLEVRGVVEARPGRRFRLAHGWRTR